MFRWLPLIFLTTVGLLTFGPLSLGDEGATPLAPVRVFGTDRATLIESGHPGVVSKQVIEDQKITDVNRALKQTPGVYIREEDGQGLRPNIGLRGTNPDRSKKVTLLEDGIIIGPAPYSAPAAYYTPNMNHVESLNVYKGFAATGIGPNSIGGAVDYRTQSFPDVWGSRLDASYGSFGTSNTILTHGGQTKLGTYLLNGSFWKSDGFKELDGGGDTGFNKSDIMGKWRFDLSSSRLHALEFRFGYAHEDSHETYLGLSTNDFIATPYRRYRASELDEMKWNHRQFQVHHEYQMAEESLLETDAYYHEFHRIWYRLDRFRDDTRLIDVLKNPDQGNNAIRYGILTGELDSSSLGSTNGQLYIAENNRRYFSQGLQSKYSSVFSFGSLKLKPWLFLRLHQDQIKRNHTADGYEMLNGSMSRTSDLSISDARNTESATALTQVVGGDILVSKWVVTPVLRRELVWYEYENEKNSSTNSSRESDTYLPGLSLLLKPFENFSGRVSWNKAATISGLSTQGDEVKEDADNFEFELKYIDPLNLTALQLTGFYMDYKNLTGTCSASSGCEASNIGSAFNGGKALVRGFELALAKGFEWGPLFIPLRAGATILDAQFRSSFRSDSDEWGSGSVRYGDPLPYIPMYQYTFDFGLVWQRWRQNLIFFYQSEVYNQSVQEERVTIADFGVVDWALHYEWSKKLDLFFKADNLLAREYAVSAHPFGLRPGKPQSFQAGLSYDF